MLNVVILAAGKGTRMRSAKAKVLHSLAGKPFLQHVIDRSIELTAQKMVVVVGHGAEDVKSAITNDTVDFAVQNEQLGTGHAVLQALPNIDPTSTVLILYGDVPLIKSETLAQLSSLVSEQAMALLTVKLDEPFGYGRIIRGEDGEVKAVVEQKDASPSQQSITEVNTGVMAVRAEDLHRWLPRLSDNNAQKEYLLPDIIALAQQEGKAIHTAMPGDPSEVLGVNNRMQQAALERIYQANYAKSLMEQGLTLLDPSRFDCRGTLTAGQDCLIDVNCIFEGEVSLGNNVTIEPNCHLVDAVIGDNVHIKAYTSIENAVLKAGAVVGPYARLRPGSVLEEGAKVGNFVEVKKATIGKGSKVNHLSYIGDALMGSDVNIGAGTITCNYDGANKSQTTIGDGVFVGSNTALVAPVSIGEKATVGAGSVITVDVAESSLAVSRSKQKKIDGWVRPTKNKQ